MTRPTLLLDEKRCRRNIARMAAKARRLGLRLRPHAKTHGSREIARWFRAEGVDAMTVSSLDMAAHFAEDGAGDVTVAFPFNLRETDRARRLAERIRLGCLVDGPAAVDALAALGPAADLWIKVDVGYGRAGVAWGRPETVAELARAARASRTLAFRGLLTHSGHSYEAGSPEGILRVHETSLARMASVKAHLVSAGLGPVEVSVGDTPTASLADAFPGVDELRPGNFVFFDLAQLGLGACREEDLALAVACPVVGVYPGRGEAVVYGGAVHFSKETAPGPGGDSVFALGAHVTAKGLGRLRPEVRLVRLSQEHGVVRCPDAGRLAPGDLLAFYPAHACLTANLHGAYRTLEGAAVARMAPRPES